MAKICAFCPAEAVKHGGEHAWSNWMNQFITSRKFRFASFNETGKHRTWIRRKLNEKLPVVCESCNNEWMSDLENDHAKPAIKDLLVSDKLIKLSPERLRSIAIFAFKTAVVADHYSIGESSASPFFSAAARYAFRESLKIPGGVQMWISAAKESGHGTLRGCYYPSPPEARHGFKFYALTFGAGYFLVQVVASKWLDPSSAPGNFPFLTSGKHWNKFSEPFWPSDGKPIQWPFDKQFNLVWLNQFCNRWRRINVPTDWL
jgi:hypothetical protein